MGSVPVGPVLTRFFVMCLGTGKIFERTLFSALSIQDFANKMKNFGNDLEFDIEDIAGNI